MDSVLKRFIHACFNQVHFNFNWKLNNRITHKVQSNPFNKDTEGVIESVRIKACPVLSVLNLEKM